MVHLPADSEVTVVSLVRDSLPAWKRRGIRAEMVIKKLEGAFVDIALVWG